MTEKKIIRDPENYRQMAIPYENSEEANKAMAGFHEELSELRKKYKIRDLLVVVYGSVISEGEEGDFLTELTFGNSAAHLSMAAYAYGKEKEIQDKMISKLLAGKTK